MQRLHEPNERADLKCAHKLSHRLQSGSKKTSRNLAHPMTFILEQAHRERAGGKRDDSPNRDEKEKHHQISYLQSQFLDNLQLFVVSFSFS